MRQREGFFFAPKHSTEKFFRKFFHNYPKRLFADFLARICDEGKGCLPSALWGGLSLWACGLVGLSLLHSFLPFLPFPSPFPRSLVVPALSLVVSLVGLSCWWVVLGFPCSLVPRSLWACWVVGFPASNLIVQHWERREHREHLHPSGQPLDYREHSEQGKRLKIG